MPKSKVRKKKNDTDYIDALVEGDDDPSESPRWLAPVMIASFLIGLFWIVIFYLTRTSYPIPGVGNWNMVIGFGFIGVGFSLATRWK